MMGREASTKAQTQILTKALERLPLCKVIFPLVVSELHDCAYLVGATPEGFLACSSYACSSDVAQNHSAISQVGSSLWSLGGLTQTFVYDLGSSMMICCCRVSWFNRR